MRDAVVQVDGNAIFESSQNPGFLKNRFDVFLPTGLSSGQHHLNIRITNRGGPCLVLAYSPALGVTTDHSWRASHDGQVWVAAALASDIQDAPELQQLATVPQAFVRSLPLILLVVVPITCGIMRFDRPWKKLPYPFQTTGAAEFMRRLLLLAWVVLGVNNIGKIPSHFGYDVGGHLEYIKVVGTGRLPLAGDGWQMFQAPLYYLVSAPLYRLVIHFLSTDNSQKALRIVPLLCGLGQVEICYRVMRCALPDRDDLQAIGTLIGGLLPVNVYMAQSLSNEPLAGFLGAATILMAIRFASQSFVARKADVARPRFFFGWGLMVGLALLAKVSAALWVPPILVLIVFKMFTRAVPVADIAKAITVFLGAVCLVSGWYYIRNWIMLGQPFIAHANALEEYQVGSWNPAASAAWWQDPGYLTPESFLRFGRVLIQPVYAATHGVWDSLYSTLWTDGMLSALDPRYMWFLPWNYNFLISTVWWAILPMFAILVGATGAIFQPKARENIPAPSISPTLLRFAVGCIAIGIAAILHQYLIFPVYCYAKSSYLLGATPCFALLAAAGMDSFLRRPFLRPLIYALLTAWAISVYFAFFVL